MKKIISVLIFIFFAFFSKAQTIKISSDSLDIYQNTKQFFTKKINNDLIQLITLDFQQLNGTNDNGNITVVISTRLDSAKVIKEVKVEEDSAFVRKVRRMQKEVDDFKNQRPELKNKISQTIDIDKFRFLLFI